MRLLPFTLPATLFATLLAAPVPATAQDRPFCADRPGLGTPACTLSPGTIQLEAGLADGTRDEAGGVKTFQVQIADTLVRVGLTNQMEAQVAFTPFGTVKTEIGPFAERRSGVGDLRLFLRRNLLSPDGSGTSLAIMPGVTLPTGGDAIGQGTTSFSLLIPFGTPLPGGFSFGATPEIGAAADSDGSGRHLAFGSVVGVSHGIGPVGVTAELSVFRDDDPAGRTTQSLAALSAAWQPADDWQLDLGTAFGLNRDTADSRVYFGVVRRF